MYYAGTHEGNHNIIHSHIILIHVCTYYVILTQRISVINKKNHFCDVKPVGVASFFHTIGQLTVLLHTAFSEAVSCSLCVCE